MVKVKKVKGKRINNYRKNIKEIYYLYQIKYYNNGKFGTIK